MSRALRLIARALLGFAVVAMPAGGALTLWFTLPGADSARAVLALAFAALALGTLTALARRRRMALALVPFALAGALLLVWWSTILPSNERIWQPDVARLPSAEFDGELVTLRNIRNFAYRSASDYSERWHDRTVDLRQLDAVALIAVYGAGDAIAHTMVSFGFAGEPVTISIGAPRNA
jgi:hypothetical protein